MSSNQLITVNNIEKYINAETIEKIARKEGFLKRNRKITPLIFLQACLLISLNPINSLSSWAAAIGFLIGGTISKQALGKRFNGTCVLFIMNLLFSVLKSSSNMNKHVEGGLFSSFNRAIIQDSTTLKLPAGLAKILPGCGNQHTKKTASVKLQTSYDLLSENFLDLNLTGARRNDQAASSDILSIIQPGDLVLRDLGYFSIPVLRQIEMKDAFFLTRYPHKLNLYNTDGTKLDLPATLQKSGSLDIKVLAGEKERFPVRLVAIPVPEETANTRRRKLKENRNASVNPTREHLALMNWEIFLTNVPSSVWSAKDVSSIYGIRWRIEIIFKAWKQYFNLTGFTNASEHQVKVLIYARLLFITLFQVSIFGPWALKVKQKTGQNLSILKAAKFVSQNFRLILHALASPEGARLLEDQIIKHCTYDKRKRLNYQCIIEMLSLS